MELGYPDVGLGEARFNDLIRYGFVLILQKLSLEDKMSDDPKLTNQTPSKPTFFQVLVSAIGAAIGVQRSDVRERDFGADSPLPFVLAGLIVTLVFIGTLLTVVYLVI
ncbi:MAG: DUF2970 domain-containing protein [Gammaproteobacteria bacterium]|nr:DUF2970 domain-containing protein [Gammaproteobacteria bacterium]